MTFGEAVRAGLRRGADFTGRATRPEFWWLAALVAGGLAAAQLLDAALFGAGTVAVDASPRFPLTGAVLLASALPLLSGAWRRMHDTGRSGALLLAPLLVVLLAGALVWWAASVSDPHAGAPTEAAGPLPTALIGAILAARIAVVAVPLAAIVMAAVWLSRPSQPHGNRFGPGRAREPVRRRTGTRRGGGGVGT